ncbi:hypothetical protein FOA19_20300 [Rufibacter hautae]|uniref:Uncharacterized protein n=2 Tax=Rufibacter hautae TaxID=2595005 RepID=A0A5B6TKU1_9BACT|nr:hypothetical protein FOA19_20300 [Rufibacter hautae]
MFEMKFILSERLKRGRSLAYFASGTRIREGYKELPFENVILIDHSFKDVICFDQKVIKIGLTATLATGLLKEVGAKLDAFVCINEGLSEGNGHVPIQNQGIFSNILPLMKEEYIHVACPGYYGQRKWKKMFNLPQLATVLDENDVDYLDPKIFSDYYRYKKCFVWKVKKQTGEPSTFKLGSRTITVQRKNIWEDYGTRKLFIRCSPLETDNIKSVAPDVEILKDYSFERLLQYCTTNKIKRIGLSPWLRHSYNGFLSYIKDNEERFPFPQELNFYHLEKNDFKQLYALAQ